MSAPTGAPAPPATAAPLVPPEKDRVPTLMHRVEYVALRAVVGILSLLPWHAASAMGAALGKLGYWPTRIRRRLVEHQIATAMPELDDAERRRIAVGSYANLGRVAVETGIMSIRN